MDCRFPSQKTRGWRSIGFASCASSSAAKLRRMRLFVNELARSQGGCTSTAPAAATLVELCQLPRESNRDSTTSYFSLPNQPGCDTQRCIGWWVAEGWRMTELD